MPDVNTKLEIMELFSKYLLCLDERRFDVESFSEVFTENAEVIIPSKILPLRECHGLKEIRELHAALFRMIKSSHHMSGDYIFISLSEQSAEVRCNLSSCYNSFEPESSNTLITGTANFSAVNTSEGWRIQRMLRKSKSVYSFGIPTKNQEEFI